MPHSGNMTDVQTARPGEVAIDLPDRFDAHLHFIGVIRTPWATRDQCPKNSQGRTDVVATLEVDPRYEAGLPELAGFSHALVLYWLHHSRRDLIRQVPRHLGEPRGVFALRTPVRPNPIGLAVVEILEVDGSRLKIRNIDCVDGTPLLDIKPYFASTDAFPQARNAKGS